MSRPFFSRKRKGKKVDPYPLGGKGKSKSSQTKRNRGRPRKPIEASPLPMTEQKFWFLIGEAKEDPIRLQELLKNESDENLFRFQTIWDQKLSELHAKDVWNNLEGNLSDDGSDYAMCGILASGEDFYNEVLKNPTHVQAPDGELFSYGAMIVWEERHGEDSDFYDAQEKWEKTSTASASRPEIAPSKVYNTSESIDDLEERGYALAFDFPDRESAREQVAELKAQGHKAKIIPINNFSEYEVWAKRMSLKEEMQSIADQLGIPVTDVTHDHVSDWRAAHELSQEEIWARFDAKDKAGKIQIGITFKRLRDGTTSYIVAQGKTLEAARAEAGKTLDLLYGKGQTEVIGIEEENY